VNAEERDAAGSSAGGAAGETVLPEAPEWLAKLTPDQWIAAALGEIKRAEEAYRRNDAGAGLAGCRRAAGMALNAALRVRPHERWGRTYVEHLLALPKEENAPEAVREAARALMQAQPPGGPLTSLRRPNDHLRLLEAARDVMAHGYALAKGSGGVGARSGATSR
jgi:hypothetical protein